MGVITLCEEHCGLSWIFELQILTLSLCTGCMLMVHQACEAVLCGRSWWPSQFLMFRSQDMFFSMHVRAQLLPGVNQASTNVSSWGQAVLGRWCIS